MDNPDANEKTKGFGGRLPLLSPSALTAEQKSLYQYLLDSKISWANASGFLAQAPTGELLGPFNSYLFSPKMAHGFSAWVDSERAHTTLTLPVRQIIILTVGAAWGSGYEIYAHSAVGRRLGITPTTIASIIEGHEPSGIASEAAVAYRFTHELVQNKKIGNQTYSEAVDVFGIQGVVEMVHLIGVYLATSALLNAFDIPAPRRLPNSSN